MSSESSQTRPEDQELYPLETIAELFGYRDAGEISRRSTTKIWGLPQPKDGKLPLPAVVRAFTRREILPFPTAKQLRPAVVKRMTRLATSLASSENQYVRENGQLLHVLIDEERSKEAEKRNAKNAKVAVDVLTCLVKNCESAEKGEPTAALDEDLKIRLSDLPGIAILKGDKKKNSVVRLEKDHPIVMMIQAEGFAGNPEEKTPPKFHSIGHFLCAEAACAHRGRPRDKARQGSSLAEGSKARQVEEALFFALRKYWEEEAKQEDSVQEKDWVQQIIKLAWLWDLCFPFTIAVVSSSGVYSIAGPAYFETALSTGTGITNSTSSGLTSVREYYGDDYFYTQLSVEERFRKPFAKNPHRALNFDYGILNVDIPGVRYYIREKTGSEKALKEEMKMLPNPVQRLDYWEEHTALVKRATSHPWMKLATMESFPPWMALATRNCRSQQLFSIRDPELKKIAHAIVINWPNATPLHAAFSKHATGSDPVVLRMLMEVEKKIGFDSVLARLRDAPAQTIIQSRKLSNGDHDNAVNDLLRGIRSAVDP